MVPGVFFFSSFFLWLRFLSFCPKIVWREFPIIEFLSRRIRRCGLGKVHVILAVSRLLLMLLLLLFSSVGRHTHTPTHLAVLTCTHPPSCTCHSRTVCVCACTWMCVCVTSRFKTRWVGCRSASLCVLCNVKLWCCPAVLAVLGLVLCREDDQPLPSPASRPAPLPPTLLPL